MELRSDFTSFYIVFPLVNYYCCVLTTFVLSFMYSGTSRLTLQHHCILCSPSSLPLMVRFMLPYAAFLWYFLILTWKVLLAPLLRQDGDWLHFYFWEKLLSDSLRFLKKELFIFMHSVCREQMSASNTLELKLQTCELIDAGNKLRSSARDANALNLWAVSCRVPSHVCAGLLGLFFSAGKSNSHPCIC